MKVGFSMVFIGGALFAPPGPDVKSKHPGPDRVNSASEISDQVFSILRLKVQCFIGS